jgi:hypothetical protein
MTMERRRGRPPLVDGDTTTQVNLRVPSREYDRACHLALRARVSVSAVLRRGLTRVLEDDDDDEAPRE